MTDQHPLTDKNCSAIEDDLIRESGYDYDDFMCMRAGADWQLEQVIEWLEDSLEDHKYSGIGILVDWVIEDLREAMRPTTTQGDN